VKTALRAPLLIKQVLLLSQKAPTHSHNQQPHRYLHLWTVNTQVQQPPTLVNLTNTPVKMTSILSSSTVGLRPAWLCSKSKAELGKMFSDSDVATVTKTSFWGTYEWLAGSHDPGPLHPSNRVFYSRPKREKAEDVINITELRGLIMDKIAQSNPDSVRDYSGFLMSCKTTMSETTAKLIMARIALVSPAPQFMGTCTASLMSHFVTCLLILVVYIIALCSSINTTTFFSLYVRCCPVLDLTVMSRVFPHHAAILK
jgi:hypothetical protein